ncbi:MAG: TlpA disulfide reductase family protein [Deltaproteobacteria bacterium]|nr:TlpA disulfide reductase family protein [Deltaproteobacteria bacterium]
MKTSFFLPRYAVLSCMALILIFALSCSDTRPREAVKKTADAAAPDFSLKTLSGKTFKLSGQKGKPVLLIFVTTWCPSCRAEIPHYKDIYETYGRRGLEVAMIDIQEPGATVSRFASRNQIPFGILLDEQGEVAGAYGIVGVPAMVLIDKGGKILSQDYMAIDMLLETTLGKK